MWFRRKGLPQDNQDSPDSFRPVEVTTLFSVIPLSSPVNVDEIQLVKMLSLRLCSMSLPLGNRFHDPADAEGALDGHFILARQRNAQQSVERDKLIITAVDGGKSAGKCPSRISYRCIDFWLSGSS